MWEFLIHRCLRPEIGTSRSFYSCCLSIARCKPFPLMFTGCMVPLWGDWAIFCHAGSGWVGREWSTREQSLEILSHDWESNQSHRKDRQSDTFLLSLVYHDWLSVGCFHHLSAPLKSFLLRRCCNCIPRTWVSKGHSFFKLSGLRNKIFKSNETIFSRAFSSLLRVAVDILCVLFGYPM